MRRLPAAIAAAFALLLASTLYLAARNHEGLVDSNYYESASNEFAERELENREGFVVRVPDRYRAGENRFRADIATAAGPLRGARVTLAAMRPSGTRDDRGYTLREAAPGRYEGAVSLPSQGQWMLSLAVDAGTIHARRLYTVVALAGEASSAAGHVLRADAGGQEVRLSIAPWPPRSMRELDFSVALPGYAGTEPPYIDLSMHGMNMGRNRVTLSRGVDGDFRGTGVFVRCPSGRKDWEAHVTVPGRGKAVFRLELAD